jgi:hypothetical protein
MPTTITMQTVTSRHKAAAETIDAFALIGAPVHHVTTQTEPPSNRMNGINAHRALRLAVASKRQAVLLIEDDLIPSTTLPAWLNYLERTQDAVVALYLASEHFFPEALLPQARGASVPDPRPRVWPTRKLHMFWGSQAIWIPQAIAEEYLSTPRIRNDADDIRTFDSELRVFLQHAGVPLLVTFPNLVQHRQYRNVINSARQIHSSRCYRDHVRPPELPAERR